MPKLSKRVLAETFKTDCDRFFRFELANSKEKESIEIDGDRYTLGIRPGVQLMQEAGNKWEIDKYNDLIFGYGEDKITFIKKSSINARLGVKEFSEVTNIQTVLNNDTPPSAIIEGSFQIPKSVSKELQDACNEFGIEPSKAIPDIIWIRPYSTDSPLIQNDTDEPPEYELHIIDVKMAAQASLKHFTEVTFYALALDAFIRECELYNRYRVSAKGLIWPGSHDANGFKNLIKTHEANRCDDATTAALLDTLIPVPYEVYEVHVRRFFKEKMLPILRTEPLNVSWHVSSKCQLCQYLEYCSDMATTQDHLSKIPWLNKTQAELLNKVGICTTQELVENISNNSDIWNQVKSINHQLKADELGIKARAQAIHDNRPVIIETRKTHQMPNWVDMSVYITVHFDPGSGITFALGAKRVYFKPPRVKGDAPQVDEQVFIVERLEQLNPDTERNRLLEFIELVSSWYFEVNDDNEAIRRQNRAEYGRDSPKGKKTAHAFFWSQLEATQFLRMIERHMHHPDVIDKIELLIRLFPPENILPVDVETYKSQPGTIVKQVIKQLVGLPIAHDYTLIDTANKFYPFIKDDGAEFKFFQPYGFHTKLNDQIPFERAYELWKDDVMLKHSKANGGRKYTRGEISDGIKRAVTTHLNALESVVKKLRDYCGSQLKLNKPPFSAAQLRQTNVPQQSRNLIMFNKLSAITQEIENMHNTSLPIGEKEARFISLTGLREETSKYEEEVLSLINDDENFTVDRVFAFEISENCRDCKIKEGDFLCCISNEDLDVSTSSYWYIALNKNYYEAIDLLNEKGIAFAELNVKKKISEILQVTILKLNTTANVPYVIIGVPKFYQTMFQFARNNGLLDFTKPMVIDPVYKDFESKDVESTLRLIGGRAPRRTRR